MRRLLRLLLTPVFLLAGWVANLGLRFSLRRMQRNMVCGVPVVSLAKDRADEVDRIRAALELVGVYDPDRLNHMRRTFRAILIRSLHYLGAKLHRSLVVCQVDLDFARKASVTALALVLVHEAQHAHCSVRRDYDQLEARLAEERECLKAELAFAARLPNSRELTHSIQLRFASLERQYSDSALQDSINATLRGEGVPEWLLRLTDREYPPRGGADGAA